MLIKTRYSNLLYGYGFFVLSSWIINEFEKNHSTLGLHIYMLRGNLGKEKLSCYPQILSLFPVKSWRRTCDRGLNSEPNQMHSKYGDANKYWYLLETSPEENRTVTFICWTHPTSERLRTMDDPSSHVITPAKITHPTLVVHEISFLSVLLWNKKKTGKVNKTFLWYSLTARMR